MALDYLIHQVCNSEVTEEQKKKEILRLHEILDPIENVMGALSNHNPNYRFSFNYLKGKYPVDSFHAYMLVHKMTTGEVNTCYKWELPVTNPDAYDWVEDDFLKQCFEDIINYIAFNEPKWDKQKEYIIGFRDYFR